MKRKIKVAVNTEKLITSEKEIDFPDIETYYKMFDDGKFFPEGLILFAFIPKSEGSKNYSLIEVKQNKQDYNDWHPDDDCNSDFWLKTFGVRKQAFKILTENYGDWSKITKEEFEESRMKLLNHYKDE